jgi:hypothetical protein
MGMGVVFQGFILGLASTAGRQPHQSLVAKPKQFRPRIGTVHLHIHPAHTHAHLRRHFQQLQAHTARGRTGQVRPRQTQRARNRSISK